MGRTRVLDSSIQESEKNSQLVKALNLVTAELKENYSEEKATITKLLVNEIRKEQKLNKKDVNKLIKIKQDIEIPTSIFYKEMGTLESVIKYLKENINLSYHEIAELLNRDDRTIWTAYHKAIKKNNRPFEIKESDKKLPSSVLVNDGLTILESIVFYLKSQGLKYSEISEILDRDQRNVWTIYSLSIKKLGELKR
jgi:hypothetical protein